MTDYDNYISLKLAGDEMRIFQKNGWLSGRIGRSLRRELRRAEERVVQL